MQKFVTIAMFALSAIILAACLPDLSIPSINVSRITAPAPAEPAGPPLYCEIGKGSALFGREWYDFQDTIFALNRGQTAQVNVTRVRSNQQMAIQALFDGSGQKLIFCPFVRAEGGERIACTSLYTLEDDLKAGIKRTFDIPQAVRGGAITCAFDQQRLSPLSTASY